MRIIKTIINTFKNTLTLKNEHIIYGEVSYFNKNNNTIISNLHINEQYRNNGYATKLLEAVEQIGIDEVKIDQHYFKLCAWDPIDSPHLVSFYKKRGYSVDPIKSTKYYDDGDRIFELVQMTKPKNN